MIEQVYDILIKIVTGQWVWVTVSNGNIVGWWEITDWYGPFHTMAAFISYLFAR